MNNQAKIILEKFFLKDFGQNNLSIDLSSSENTFIFLKGVYCPRFWDLEAIDANPKITNFKWVPFLAYCNVLLDKGDIYSQQKISSIGFSLEGMCEEHGEVFPISNLRYQEKNNLSFIRPYCEDNGLEFSFEYDSNKEVFVGDYRYELKSPPSWIKPSDIVSYFPAFVSVKKISVPKDFALKLESNQ